MFLQLFIELDAHFNGFIIVLYVWVAKVSVIMISIPFIQAYWAFCNNPRDSIMFKFFSYEVSAKVSETCEAVRME